jgi:hypothetical protein
MDFKLGHYPPVELGRPKDNYLLFGIHLFKIGGRRHAAVGRRLLDPGLARSGSTEVSWPFR